MTYRVGNHQPQNVYRDDQYIGVMFTAEDAALVVEALNGAAHRGHNHPVELDDYCEDQAEPWTVPVDHAYCICDGSGRTCPRHGAVI